MFTIWDSRQQDWQLFWLSFEHWGSVQTIVIISILLLDLRIQSNKVSTEYDDVFLL